MVICRKCGRKVKEKKISQKNLSENRRGRVASEKVCSDCN